MRVWDIADRVFPGLQITHVPPKQARFRGIVSSAGKVAFSLGLVVASSGVFTATGQDYASGFSTKVQIVTVRPGSLRPSAEKLILSSTDTQFGQSTLKLSQSFTAYFQPALEEDKYEDDYSF